MTQLMAPQDTNLLGNVFGGVILAAVDRIAYVCASRHAGGPSVTASFDQVDFRSPIQIGEVVTVERLGEHGRTDLDGDRREGHGGAGHGRRRRHTNSCYVTMVAMDPEGRPVRPCRSWRSNRGRVPAAPGRGGTTGGAPRAGEGRRVSRENGRRLTPDRPAASV